VGVRTRSRKARRMAYLALCIVLPAVGAATASDGGTFPAELAAELDALVAEYMARGLTPGIAVGVRIGDARWVRAYGAADAETGAPLTIASSFYIGSLTKQMTAAAILRLVEEGRLSLEQTVDSILDDVPEAWAGITIHHLLTHTAGIKSYGSLPYDLGEGALPSRALVGFIAAVDPVYAPGEGYLYSSADYAILGYAIERRSGLPFGGFLDLHLFRPLGMSDSGFWVDDRPEDLVVGHSVYVDGAATFIPSVNVSAGLGAACVHSTVDDLLTWQEGLVCGRVVSPASYVLMTTPATIDPPDGPVETINYGYGLELDVGPNERPIAVWHGGGNGGQISYIWWMADRDVAFVVLQNSDGLYYELLESIKRVLIGCSE